MGEDEEYFSIEGGGSRLDNLYGELANKGKDLFVKVSKDGSRTLFAWNRSKKEHSSDYRLKLRDSDLEELAKIENLHLSGGDKIYFYYHPIDGDNFFPRIDEIYEEYLFNNSAFLLYSPDKNNYSGLV